MPSCAGRSGPTSSSSSPISCSRSPTCCCWPSTTAASPPIGTSPHPQVVRRGLGRPAAVDRPPDQLRDRGLRRHPFHHPGPGRRDHAHPAPDPGQEPALCRPGLADPGPRHRAGHLDLHLLEPEDGLSRLLVDGGPGPVELHLGLLHADLHGPPAALRHHAGGGRPSTSAPTRARCSGASPCPTCALPSSPPAALAFLQSFENYTTTYFAIGAGQTFTIFIANKVRQGVTPAVNAVAFVIVALTIAAAVGVEVYRRREERRKRAAAWAAEKHDLALATAAPLARPA